MIQWNLRTFDPNVNNRVLADMLMPVNQYMSLILGMINLTNVFLIWYLLLALNKKIRID